MTLLPYEQVIVIKTFECDFNHHWKPASFLQHMTEAAGVHAATLGFGYSEMQAQGLFWVLSRIKIKFFRFPAGGEQIILRTWPKTIQQKLFYIRDFEILADDNRLLAASTSAWLVVDADSRRLVPPGVRSLNLPALPEKHGLDDSLDKIPLNGDAREALQIQAGYSSTDVLGHVNNSRYAEWICDSLPMEYFQHNQLDWLQINYDREVLPGDQVSIRVSPFSLNQTLTWYLEGINSSRDTRAFEASLQFKTN